MTTPAAAPKTTREGSPSPSQPEQDQTPPASRVTSPGLGVRRPTPSPETASQPTGAADSQNAGEPLGPDPLVANGSIPSASEDPDAKPLKVGKRPLAEVFRGLILGASFAVHNALARSELEQAHGVWAMQDEAEAAGIADPLASIATRRAGGQLVNADLGDLIAAGVATAGYVISNALKAFQIRRAEREMRRAGVNPSGEQPRQETQQ